MQQVVSFISLQPDPETPYVVDAGEDGCGGEGYDYLDDAEMWAAYMRDEEEEERFEGALLAFRWMESRCSEG